MVLCHCKQQLMNFQGGIIMKERIRLKENSNGWNFIETEVKYSLGGMNYFMGKEERRGYYLHIQPIQIERGWVTRTGFSGAKWLLKETKRKSAKAEQEAIKEANLIRDNCIKLILDKHELELE